MNAFAPTTPVTEEDIHRLVHHFYELVRKDDDLGPIFDAKINDWEPHLQQMCNFWSSVMLKSGRYQGRPMPKHIALVGTAHPEHFNVWLSLFEKAAYEVCAEDVANAFLDRARQIAESLKFGMFGTLTVPNIHPAA